MITLHSLWLPTTQGWYLRMPHLSPVSCRSQPLTGTLMPMAGSSTPSRMGKMGMEILPLMCPISCLSYLSPFWHSGRASVVTSGWD
uniref:Uncharacterized protein n=1 Tax=Ursus maritimus TaxID=29073 RepID=A0A452SY62_URSMA